MLEPGTYTVLVEGWYSREGNFSLSVTCGALPTAPPTGPPPSRNSICKSNSLPAPVVVPLSHYSNWASDAPDSVHGNTCMFRGRDGEWEDAAATASCGAVCPYRRLSNVPPDPLGGGLPAPTAAPPPPGDCSLVVIYDPVASCTSTVSPTGSPTATPTSVPTGVPSTPAPTATPTTPAPTVTASPTQNPTFPDGTIDGSSSDASNSDGGGGGGDSTTIAIVAVLAVGVVALCLIIAGVVVCTKRPNGMLATPAQSFDNPLYDMGQRRGSSHFYSADGSNARQHFATDSSLNGNQRTNDDTYGDNGTINPLYSMAETDHDGHTDCSEEVSGYCT